MKNAILFIFLCFTFIAKGQQYWMFPSINKNHWQAYIVKNQIKKITNKTKSKIFSFKKTIEYDNAGEATSITFNSSTEKRKVFHFYYEKMNNQLIERIIEKNEKKYDSTLYIMLNDTILESKRYSSGKLEFYNKYTSNSQRNLTSKISIYHNQNTEDFFYDSDFRDSVIHTTFHYLDSNTIFIFSRYNKNNYSKALVYLNHDKNIIKRDVEYQNPEKKISRNYVEIYNYNKDNLLKKKYCISIDDFTKITQNPQAKIRYLYFENYEYNQKNLLSKVTLFNNLGLYQYKPFESVTTYTYEYQ